MLELEQMSSPLSGLPITDKLPNDLHKHVTIAWGQGQNNTQSMGLATILM